jgi:hypothetical protein
MQHRLKAAGLRPINSIVDITNYVMLECGQPLHAFDGDKIKGKKVIIKTLPDGTTFRTLDDKEVKLRNLDLMICDESEGMCIAGVYRWCSFRCHRCHSNHFPGKRLLPSQVYSKDFYLFTSCAPMPPHVLKRDGSE